jgi:TPR repeat protein
MRGIFYPLLVVTFALFSGHSFSSAQTAPPIDEEELRLWADKGEPDAQFDLGLRLVTGEGIKKSEKEGAEYIRKSAVQNHLRAQCVLGSLYEEGVGVEKDIPKAVEWYAKSANAGFPLAQHSLGILYDAGTGVPKDPKQSAVWFRKAANQDFAPSLAAYASKLEHGEGVEKSTTKAASYYLRSAKGDYLPAMSKIAYLYYTGVGVPVDYRRTSAWYLRAARSGEPWATNDLAWFLATCPDESFHDGETALTLSKAAVKLIAEQSGEQRHEMLDTLAASMARAGDFLGAVLWQKKSIALLAEDKNVKSEDRDKLNKEFAERLKLYQKQTPYTEKEPEAEKGAVPLAEDTILEEEGTPEVRPKPKSKIKPQSGGGSVVFRLN